MIIIKRFLKSFIITSLFFLIAGIAIIYQQFNAIYTKSVTEALYAEISSASVLASKEYGLGDIITLKSSLDSLATGRGWIKADLIDNNGESIWSYRNEQTTTDGEINNSKSAREDIIQLTTNVLSDGHSTIGKITVSKSFENERHNFLLLIAAVILGFVIFWVLFLCLIWVFASRAFRPIVNMSNSVQERAKSLSLILKRDHKIDEILQVQNWFEKLSSEWEKARDNAIENERYIAIAKTTQLLAHDVRKPFSAIKSILNGLNLLKDNPSELEILKKEVNKSIKHVESMIADILDFSRETKLETKPVSVISFLEFCVRQTAQSYRDAKIEFTYVINNKHKPLLDEDRMSRVLGNIIGNGIEAITIMGQKSSGVIDINVFEQDDKIHISIGNNGPIFPPGVETKLFESFFTKGKSKGTGLGLASAKKVALLHGGNIYAQNKSDGSGVEFIFTLPISTAEQSLNDIDTLPKSIVEIIQTNVAPTSSDDIALSEVINKVMTTTNNGSTLKMLLLEDELLYKAGVRNLIKQHEALHKNLVLYECSKVDEALTLIKSEKLTWAIVDIDLGQEKSGFDFLREIQIINSNRKEHEQKIKTVVHSNRCAPDDNEKFKNLGADLIAPKPLMLDHLIKFLQLAIDTNSPQEISQSDIAKGTTTAKKVLYCDDEKYNRIFMKKNIEGLGRKDIDFEIFDSAESLLTRIRELGKADIVFSDQNMGAMSGLDLCEQIRKENIPTKFYFLTNEELKMFETKVKNVGGDGCFTPPSEDEEWSKLFSLIK
ncbi:MAG: response regulator [Oligoflexia bacterium]|nr:response regulator [Oligoflexia bacterium]